MRLYFLLLSVLHCLLYRSSLRSSFMLIYAAWLAQKPAGWGPAPWLPAVCVRRGGGLGWPQQTPFNLIHRRVKKRLGGKLRRGREGDNQEARSLWMCFVMTWKRLHLETESKEEQSQAEHDWLSWCEWCCHWWGPTHLNVFSDRRVWGRFWILQKCPPLINQPAVLCVCLYGQMCLKFCYLAAICTFIWWDRAAA